jgi:hypothetical protein
MKPRRGRIRSHRWNIFMCNNSAVVANLMCLSLLNSASIVCSNVGMATQAYDVVLCPLIGGIKVWLENGEVEWPMFGL